MQGPVESRAIDPGGAVAGRQSISTCSTWRSTGAIAGRQSVARGSTGAPEANELRALPRKAAVMSCTLHCKSGLSPFFGVVTHDGPEAWTTSAPSGVTETRREGVST